MQNSMVRARMNASEGESDKLSIHVMRDRIVPNYIRKRLSIQNENNWSQDRAQGDPTSHLQLLLVSYLEVKKRITTKQDHRHRKCFQGESEECYDR